ncbi:MAG: TIGR04282 family arsenosugar biosynthesis glycosyltransferase [Nonlabens sp.]
MKKNKNCLVIFTRNPELGKGKRRLAATVGDHKALAVYKLLLHHTRSVTDALPVTRQVWYSERVHDDDDWSNNKYEKFVQKGDDLGERMQHALETALEDHENAIVIGSDLFELKSSDLETAFKQLEDNDAVIGPATDGGYYLLGFHKRMAPAVFKNKSWGTESVYRDTMADLKSHRTFILEERNDVDYYEDIKDAPEFQHILNP